MSEDNILFRVATWLIPLVVAIILHEIAHGWTALAFGDPTAKRKRRLSLNPIRHVDPLGTIILPLILAVSNAGAIFGWAKPVPINYRRLKRPRRDMILVSLAGPGMNLLLAIAGVLLLAATIALSGGAESGAARFVAFNALNFIYINIFLGIFNLLPIPPFDGGHVVEGLLPRRAARSFRKIGRYSLLVLVVLLLGLPAVGIDVAGRVVSPLVDWLAAALLGLVGLNP